jgi:putative colanic acid biosynthesis UDP-glucose lipid carrier transferase
MDGMNVAVEPKPAGLIRPYNAILAELFRLLDVVLVGASLAIVTLVYDVRWTSAYNQAALLAMFSFFAWAYLLRLYASWRIATLFQELRRLLAVWVGVIFTLVAVGYVTRASAVFSHEVLLTWLLLFAPATLGASRAIVRHSLRTLRKRGHNTRNVAIVGSGEVADRLCTYIRESPWLGLNIQGVYNDPGWHPGKPFPEGCREYQRLLTLARLGEIDMVFMAIPMEQHALVERFTSALADTTASLYYVPNFFMSELIWARWGYMGDIPYLSLRETPFYGVGGTLKRFEDIFLSLLILCIIAVPMILIAIGVKLSSPGPVLFKQRRYGLDGREIQVWKFRTMTVCEDGDQVRQARRDDPRMTPFGRFLRRTSMDEFPQFINVLRGEMSLVGPRPHAVAHNEEYRRQIYGYMLRHKVKPGITGWAQVNGWRGETDTLDKMEGRVKHDLWYIQNWSLWLDLRIIFLTIVKGFTDKHAY